MGALKEKRLGKVVRDVTDWTEKNRQMFDRIEELQFGARIVVKIKRYMRTNGLSQKQLADRLGVSPQYINKMLHGNAMDMKISTAWRYGQILGIDLIAIPEEPKRAETQIIIHQNVIDWTAPYPGPKCDNPQSGTYTHTNPLCLRKSQKQNSYGIRPS